MLWLACHLPLLPLTALADERAGLAVTASRGARRWLVAAADRALHPGEDLLHARARKPDLIAVARAPEREQAALDALAACAYRYGDRIVRSVLESDRDYGLPRHGLWLEVGASLRLFGGLQALVDGLLADLAALGHVVQTGIAPTPEAAAVLARAGSAHPVLALDALPAALAPLPLALGPLPAATLDWLADAGVTTYGALFALPHAGLRRRGGAALTDHLDRLLGRRPDPRPLWHPPQRYRRRLELVTAVDDRERLLFPLRRLCDELAGYLLARDRAVQQFRLCLEHEDAPTTIVAFALAEATRDAGRLLRVLRERLAAAGPGAAVDALQLEADRFATPPTPQSDLFDRHRHQATAAGEVLERLRARLGEDAVWWPQCIDDHRPERAWRSSAQPAGIRPARPTAARPLWFLRQPRRLSRPPPLTGGVERIEGGWWDTSDQRRDYFFCTLEDGRTGWVSHDLDRGELTLLGLERPIP
jgi:hypothetical protein